MNKEKKLSDGTLNVMEKAFTQYDFIFSEPVTKASLIHGDLNIMNIMTDANLKNICVIDPLESKWADKERVRFVSVAKYRWRQFSFV